MEASARHRQLNLLLDSDPLLASKLMRGHNNNASTPLLVAASGIMHQDHAAVFRRLLHAADAVDLAAITKSGLCLRVTGMTS